MLASKNRWTIFILKQFEKAWYFFLKCLIKFTSDNICAQIFFITKFLNVLSAYLTDTKLFRFYISSWSSLHNVSKNLFVSPTLVIKFIGITLSIIFSCYPFDVYRVSSFTVFPFMVFLLIICAFLSLSWNIAF